MTTRAFNRRSFLKTASGLALTPAIPFVPGMAHGADSNVVVGTWGGDYQNLLQQYISPLVTKHGTSVIFDTGNAVPRLTKLRAERNSRRGSMDVALLGEVDMFEAARVGALIDVNSTNVPNLGNVYEQFKTGYSIPHIFSAMTLVYNTEKFSTPPDSLNIMLDPANKGRVGFSDNLFMYSALFVGMANGGQKVNSFDPGRKFLMESKKNAPRVYPSNEAVAAAFKSGEIWVACMWKARALQWQDAGLPLGFVVPKEGTISVVFEGAVAKNSRNPKGAWQFMNALLEPEGQVHFARAIGYAPTVNNAQLPADLEARVGFSDEEHKRIYPYDLKPLVDTKAGFLDFWTKEFKVGL